jgi:pyruvate,water dikinase
MSDAARGVVVPITRSAELPAAAGGKALGLAAIARAGLPVPDAWAVLPGAGEAALGELSRALRERGIRSVAVRSSAADEDGARSSFAGIHETELGVPLERVGESVAAIAASATSPRAVAYRRRLGLPDTKGRCAVVVQAMVDAECAGVAFGRGEEEVVIEAIEGLGELAVNGAVTPETLVVRLDRAGWTVAQRQPRRQREALRIDGQGPRRVMLAEQRRSGDVLSASAAAVIAAGTRALEKALGHPLDVEWAWRDGSPAFLQARPQTRSFAPEVPPGETWTRANVREVFPEIPSAMTRSAFVPLIDRAQREVLRRQGVPVDPAIPILTCVHGRPVFNERVFAAADLLGVSRGWAQALLGGVGGAPSNELARISPWRVLGHPRLVVGSLSVSMGADGRAKRYLVELRRKRSERWSVPAEEESDLRIVARVRAAISEDVATGFRHTLGVAAAVAGPLFRATALLGPLEAPASEVARLLSVDDVSVSTRQLEDLLSLALAFRSWRGGAAFVSPVVLEHAQRDHWSARLPPGLWEAVERWLADHGHRGPCDLELSSPRYRDDLRLLARALEPLVTASETRLGPAERGERRHRERARAWDELAGTLGTRRRKRLRGAVEELSQGMALREQLRSELAAHCGCVRRDLRELGHRLASRRRLETAEQIFDLSLEELASAIEDPASDAVGPALRERARLASWRRVEVPNRFTSEDVAAFGLRTAGPRNAVTTVLRGTAVSPGDVEGTVCVLRSPAEEHRMRPGGILVAPATDPGWTPLFARAAGVVVEVGGLLSHAATVAREFGLPCVSNVEGATELLRDGDVVRVDGTRGIVERVAST